MTDDELMDQFEAAALDPLKFSHEYHVRLGWLYVQKFELAEAIDRFANALKRFTKVVGAEAKYHQTITWFYMLLIAERQAAGNYADFDSFLAANRDLVGKPSILLRYYSAEVLASDLARQHYILPDLAVKKAA